MESENIKINEKFDKLNEEYKTQILINDNLNKFQ